MPARSLYVLIIGIVALFAAALLATLTLRPHRQQENMIPQASSSADGEAMVSPAHDAELAAQRELICVDRVLAGAVPEGSTIPAELGKCSQAAYAFKAGQITRDQE